MNLCKFKNIFGEPNTGLHVYRIFDIAIVDVILTVIIGFIIHKKIKTKSNISLKSILIYLFILSIIAHRIFCVRTTIDKLLF